jgi:hypothetical protein
MMGNSSGGASLQNRTAVGLRALTTVTPATPQQIAKAKGADKAKLDRVERDEERRSRLFEVYEEEQEEAGLAQPPGHGETLRLWPGEAFRTDAQGRPLPPVFGDVDQGNLGDAWLMASCAAVAHRLPDALRERVRRRDEKSFRVLLGKEEVVVTPDFPSEGYAEPNPNGQADTLWVALIEKAFALYEAASYANLETGSPGRALELLTGRRAARLSVSEHLDPARVMARLVAAKGSPMVMRTREAGVVAPLIADHAYAVLEVEAARGLCRLYNPWGTASGTRPLESAIHEVPLARLLNEAEAFHFTL